MDLKLGNINHGELEIKNNDLMLVEDRNSEILQMIAVMLQIRAGELEFDTNYGLDWAYWETGNKTLVEENIRNKILYYFREVNKINTVTSKFLTGDRRKLQVFISLEINNQTYEKSLEV